MSFGLHREIDHLKTRILTLGAAVENQVHLAVRSISLRDENLARKVIEGDSEIDNLEVELEEECLKVLALHQPVATDLRFIIAVLKINNELERIGDLAVNIGERAGYLAVNPPVDIPFDFPAMSEKVKTMLKTSLDALVNTDVRSAYRVCDMDNEVDSINRRMYEQVQSGIRSAPDKMDRLIHLLSVSRHLERIGDSATNIAEDVIYMIQGKIIRHKTEEYAPDHRNGENRETGKQEGLP